MPVTLVKCVEMTLLLLLLLLIRIATNNCEAYSNCTFVYNENQNYSFSRLSKQEVWKVRVYNRSEFAYISVCNRPNNTQYPCKESSFCVSRDSLGTWKIGLSNISSYKIQQAKQDDSRKFYMKLEGTQPCALDSRKNYSVNIYFKCSRVDDDPKMVERQEDGCMLLITWDTPAACPVVKDCAFGNYDLSSLANPVFYNVSTYDGRLFELSLCGKLPQSSPCYLNDTNLVTACEVIQKSNTSVIIGQNPPALALVPNSGLTLTYKTKKKGSKTIVKLICNMDAEESTPQFTSVVGKTYYFEMETAVACNAFPQECVAFDRRRGGSFDLKSLRMKDNWVIPSKNPNELYYINVCGPLNAVSNFTAISEGHMEACLVNIKNKSVTNLGTVIGGPSMKEDVLTLQYVEGALCPNGGRHKIEIEFSCSKFNNGPLYIMTTKECVHHFSWETSVACPTLLDIGKDCKVRDLQHGHLYDFNTLHSEWDKLILTESDSSFRINLCRPLSKPCGNKNASICLKTGNKEIAIGIDASSPIYKDGGLSLVSEGDACKSGYNKSTVTIILKCSHRPGNGEPELLLDLPEGCDFYFLWLTNAACPPPHSSSCTVEHQGQFYDLSPLTETEMNRIVPQREKKLKFILNVCHSVIHGAEAKCEYTSAACMLNMSDSNINTKFINIGDVGSGPYIDPADGKLKITYRNGKICLNGVPDHMYTVITFECAEEDSDPIPMVGDVCVYEFLWKTRAACPDGVFKVEPKQLPNNDCSVVDPVTKERFDLSKLQNIVETVPDKVSGHNYTFVVCGNLTNSPCGNASGVCQEKSNEHWNAGVGNSKLKYQRHALLLEYENGTPCNNNLKRKTTIEFICADDSSEQVFFVDETKDCSYLISWHTKLACRQNYYEDCRSDDIQLEPLIRQEKNYVVKGANDTVFYINVCKPLIPERGLGCSGGPSICMAHEKDGKLVDEQNIGFHEKLIKTGEGKVTIVLSNGTSVNTTAEMHLECDLTNGFGEPQLNQITTNQFKNETKYNFIWKTNVTCPSYKKEVSSSKDHCIIHNDQLNGSLNLKELGSHGVIMVDGKSHKYKVDLCGSGIHAEHSKDGFLSNLHGSLSSVTFYYQQRQASLYFTSDVSCSSTTDEETFQSELLLSCVPGKDAKKPEVKENNCGIVITWQNPLVCEVLIAGYPHHIPHVGEKEEESGGISAGAIIGLMLLGVALLCSVLYFRKPSNRSQLKNRLSSLLGIRHSAQFHYSRLEAADEASQLLVSHLDGQESDSDDELLRM